MQTITIENVTQGAEAWDAIKALIQDNWQRFTFTFNEAGNVDIHAEKDEGA